jgi:hypothetical protein
MQPINPNLANPPFVNIQNSIPNPKPPFISHNPTFYPVTQPNSKPIIERNGQINHLQVNRPLSPIDNEIGMMAHNNEQQNSPPIFVWGKEP